MTRWWWFGGAVAPGEITRDLELMREAGLRGVELQPVHPLATDDPARGIRNVAYFSSAWFDLLRHTAKETRRLGLQFDFTLGSGWPYGGPFIPAELAARRLRLLSKDAVGDREFTWNLAPHIVAQEKLVSVNPVAVYLPLADVFAQFGLGALHIDEELEKHTGRELFDRLRRSGYDFDLINDRALSERGRVDEGKLHIGSGKYSVVLVPSARFMPPESLERLAEFAAGGGAVIFIGRCPEAPPGLSRKDERESRFRAVLEKLGCSGDPTPDKMRGLGKGRIALAGGLAADLELLHSKLEPDFYIFAAGDGSEEALNFARENVGFLHRRRGSSDFYFLSNVSNQAQNLHVQFKVGHRRAERWNLEDENSTEPLIYSYTASEGRGLTAVQLRLAPFESCFVVFGDPGKPAVVARSNFWGRMDIENRGKRNLIRGRAEENAAYWVETPSGRRYPFVVRGIPEPILLEGPWSLRLGDASAVPLSSLRSWNELPEGTSYSGWTTYESTFDVAVSSSNIEWVLDLGHVHETAVADLNGVALGAAWKGPRRLSCKDALKAGKNRLTVRVANLWIHHMKSLPAPDLSALAETYGIRWGCYGEVEAKDLPPSGLLGPVRPVPLKRWTLKI